MEFSIILCIRIGSALARVSRPSLPAATPAAPIGPSDSGRLYPCCLLAWVRRADQLACFARVGATSVTLTFFGLRCASRASEGSISAVILGRVLIRWPLACPMRSRLTTAARICSPDRLGRASAPGGEHRRDALVESVESAGPPPYRLKAAPRPRLVRPPRDAPLVGRLVRALCAMEARPARVDRGVIDRSRSPPRGLVQGPSPSRLLLLEVEGTWARGRSACGTIFLPAL